MKIWKSRTSWFYKYLALIISVHSILLKDQKLGYLSLLSTPKYGCTFKIWNALIRIFGKRKCTHDITTSLTSQGNLRNLEGTQGTQHREPKGTRGNLSEPKGTPGNPREPNGTKANPKGPEVTQRNQRNPKNCGLWNWGQTITKCNNLYPYLTWKCGVSINFILV